MSETRRERDDAHAESAVRCGAWSVGGAVWEVTRMMAFLLFRNQLSSLSLTRIILASLSPTLTRRAPLTTALLTQHDVASRS